MVTGMVTAKKIHRLGDAMGAPGSGLNVNASFMLKKDWNGLLANALGGCSGGYTHGYERAREESQGQHGYRLHSSAVLPRFLCYLRSGFGEFDVQQIVASAFFGDPARTLRDLNVESVVSLDDEIRDLQHYQHLHLISSTDSNADLQLWTGF
jgi:hypothetical protein